MSGPSPTHGYPVGTDDGFEGGLHDAATVGQQDYLAYGGGTLVDGTGDLVVLDAEHFAQHEHGPLGGGQSVQDEQHRDRDTVGQSDVVRDVGCGQQRFGQPRAGVRLTPTPHGAQPGQRLPSDHPQEMGTVVADLRQVHAGPPQPSVVEHVFGVGSRAEHLVRDGEQQVPVGDERRRRHTKDATMAGEIAVRLHLVAAWREATVFTDAERAALALAEEGTRLADAHHGVSQETWERVREHFDKDQSVALVALVAMINATNRLNVMVHNPGGSIEPSSLAGLAH